MSTLFLSFFYPFFSSPLLLPSSLPSYTPPGIPPSSLTLYLDYLLTTPPVSYTHLGPTDYTLSAYGKDGKLVASASFSDDLTPNGQLDFILLDDSLVRADEIAIDASYDISQSIADGTVIHSITNASGALKQATQDCILQHYASSSIVVNPDPVPNDMYYQITIHDSSENQSVYQVFLYGGDVIVKEKDGISSIIPRQVYDNFNELFLESTAK